jgi:hypothetical protein
MDEEVRQWQRRHSNGWHGMVTRDEDRQYTFGAGAPDPVPGNAKFENAASLEAAKRLADDAVAERSDHRCGSNCGEWFGDESPAESREK